MPLVDRYPRFYSGRHRAQIGQPEIPSIFVCSPQTVKSSKGRSSDCFRFGAFPTRCQWPRVSKTFYSFSELKLTAAGTVADLHGILLIP